MTNSSSTKSKICHTHHLIKALFLVSLLALLYWPVIVNLTRAWAIKPQSSHGYFILPIVIWLCWIRKDRFAGLQIRGSHLGLFLLATGLFLYILATLACTDTIANISMMLSIAGVGLATLGPAVFRAYLFPYVFLIFMFPVPDAMYVSLTNPLKLFASDVSADLLQSVGVTTYQDGNILQFSNFTMEVVEACSGMRSLITYLMLGTLLSSFLKGYFWNKCLLVFSTIPIAFFNNILRITGTGILAHWYGQKVAHGFFHGFTGLTTFVLGFFVMLGIYRLLSKKKSETKGLSRCRLFEPKNK